MRYVRRQSCHETSDCKARRPLIMSAMPISTCRATGHERPNSADTAGTPRSLLAALPNALPTTMTATGPTPKAGNDLYEAYLFELVLTAARREGFTITLADADGLATVLRLRRGPGRLPSGGPQGARFTHAVLACPPRPTLELHTGVGVVGQSKVVYEADVLVVLC